MGYYDSGKAEFKADILAKDDGVLGHTVVQPDSISVSCNSISPCGGRNRTIQGQYSGRDAFDACTIVSS